MFCSMLRLDDSLSSFLISMLTICAPNKARVISTLGDIWHLIHAAISVFEAYDLACPDLLLPPFSVLCKRLTLLFVGDGWVY